MALTNPLSPYQWVGGNERVATARVGSAQRAKLQQVLYKPGREVLRRIRYLERQLSHVNIAYLGHLQGIKHNIAIITTPERLLYLPIRVS